jgi:hypothetical protein
MKNAILVLIITFSNLIYCQTNCDCAERLKYKAEYLFLNGKNEEALSSFQNMLKFKPPESYTPTDDIYYAKYLIACNHLDSAFLYLKRGYENGANSIENHPDFKKIVESHYFEDLKNVKRITFNNFNWIFYNKIIEARGIDQAIRRNGALKDVFSNSELAYKIVDSINFKSIQKLISQYELPTYLTHGFSFSELNLLIFHFSVYSHNTFDELLVILEFAIDKGLYSKAQIANLIDRRLDWVDHKPQIYGTWNFSDRFNEIEDLKSVDSLRFQMNLLTLKDYAWMTGKSIPEGYIETPYPKEYFCED